MNNGESEVTTHHEIIRQWAEERNGHPALLEPSAPDGKSGTLHIDFNNNAKPGIKHVSWDEFFEHFERDELAFLFQDVTSSGNTSKFFKFVRR